MSVTVNASAPLPPNQGPSFFDESAKMFQASANTGAAGGGGGALMRMALNAVTPPARAVSNEMPVTAAVQYASPVAQQYVAQQQQQQQQLQQLQRAAAHPLAAPPVAPVAAPMPQQQQHQLVVAVPAAVPQHQQQQQQFARPAAPADVEDKRLEAQYAAQTFEQVLKQSGKNVITATFSRDIDFSHAAASLNPEMLVRSMIGEHIAAVEKLAPGQPTAKIMPVSIKLLKFRNMSPTSIGLNIAKVAPTVHTANDKRFVLVAEPYAEITNVDLYNPQPKLDEKQLQKYVGRSVDSIMSVAQPYRDLPLSSVPVESDLAKICLQHWPTLKLDFTTAGVEGAITVPGFKRVGRIADTYVIDNDSLAMVRDSLDGRIYNKIEHWSPEEFARVQFDRADDHQFGNPLGIASCINNEMQQEKMMAPNKLHLQIKYAYVVV